MKSSFNSRICPNCNREIQNNWLICPNCGKDLSSAESSVADPEVSSPGPSIQTPEQPTGGKIYFPPAVPQAKISPRYVFKPKINPTIIVAVLLVLTLTGVWITSTADDRVYKKAVQFQVDGDYQTAIQTYNDLVMRYPNSPFISQAKEDIQNSYLSWARDFAKNGDYKNSIDKLERLETISKTTPDGDKVEDIIVQTYISWAQDLVRSGNYQDSIDKLEKLSAISTTTPDGDKVEDIIVQTYIEWGKASLSNKSYSTGIDVLEEALKKYPSSPLKGDVQYELVQGYILWAKYFKNIPDLDSAIEKYKLVISKYPSVNSIPEAKKELANVYIEKGDQQVGLARVSDGNVSSFLKAALDWYRQASSVDPNSSTAKSKYSKFNRQYNTPTYTYHSGFTITQPLKQEIVISSLFEDIAVINNSLSSDHGNITMGEDIKYSYTYMTNNFSSWTVDSIQYPVQVSNAPSGFYTITISADVYKTSTLLYGSNTFLESQYIVFVLWIP